MKACELYRGDLMDGLSFAAPVFDEWLLIERARRHELALSAFALLLRHRQGAGDRDGAVQTAHRLLSLSRSLARGGP